MQALKLLEIVDGDGNPTPEFEKASRAPDGEYKDALSDLITATYGEVFTFADPSTDSFDRVRDAFRTFNPRGQQERMVTLFLGLLDFVGMDTSAAATSRKRGEGSPRQPKPSGSVSQPKQVRGAKQNLRTPKGQTGETDRQGGGHQDTAELPPGLVGLLQQIPRGGAGWPRSRRDEFLAAFKAVLDFSIPVRDVEPAPIPSVGSEEDSS